MAVKTNNHLKLYAKGVSLSQTLFCGQSFSWQKTKENLFTGVAAAHAVTAFQQDDYIVLENINKQKFTQEDEDFWANYFALDIDYAALQKEYCKNEMLAKCVQSASGIRLLRQPFFDTLLSFIISQNNNIPRITGITQRLRSGFGPLLAPNVHGFPLAKTLAKLSVDELAPLRSGFRARYLISAANFVSSGEITPSKLSDMSDSDTREALKLITGVGNKVADCVMLFSLNRCNVAPMDVWMKRAMSECFKDGMPKQANGTEGIAQQYIFWWAHENLKPEKKQKNNNL